MRSPQLLTDKGLRLIVIQGDFYWNNSSTFTCVVFVCCMYTNMFCYSLSALDEPSEDGESPDIAEMPIDLDIEVESVGLDENEIEQLRQDTR